MVFEARRHRVTGQQHAAKPISVVGPVYVLIIGLRVRIFILDAGRAISGEGGISNGNNKNSTYVAWTFLG